MCPASSARCTRRCSEESEERGGARRARRACRSTDEACARRGGDGAASARGQSRGSAGAHRRRRGARSCATTPKASRPSAIACSRSIRARRSSSTAWPSSWSRSIATSRPTSSRSRRSRSTRSTRWRWRRSARICCGSATTQSGWRRCARRGRAIRTTSAPTICCNLFEDVIPKEYTLVDGKPFRFRVPKEESRCLERYVEPMVEREYAELVQRYGFTPKGPLTIELYADPEHYAVRTVGLPELERARRLLRPGDHRDVAVDRHVNWGMMLWHELGARVRDPALELARAALVHRGAREYETRSRARVARRTHAELYHAIADKQLLRSAELNLGFTRARDVAHMVVTYHQAAEEVMFLVRRFGFPVVPKALRCSRRGRRRPRSSRPSRDEPQGSTTRRSRPTCARGCSRTRTTSTSGRATSPTSRRCAIRSRASQRRARQGADGDGAVKGAEGRRGAEAIEEAVEHPQSPRCCSRPARIFFAQKDRALGEADVRRAGRGKGSRGVARRRRRERLDGAQAQGAVGHPEAHDSRAAAAVEGRRHAGQREVAGRRAISAKPQPARGGGHRSPRRAARRPRARWTGAPRRSRPPRRGASRAAPAARAWRRGPARRRAAPRRGRRGRGCPERAAIADGDVAHVARRLGQERGRSRTSGEAARSAWRTSDPRASPPSGRVDALELARAVQIHQHRGAGEAHVEQRHEALATREELGLPVIRRQQGDRLRGGGRAPESTEAGLASFEAIAHGLEI